MVIALSADSACMDCSNGLPKPITSVMAPTTLPDGVIWSVTFETSAPADSLNVGAYSFPGAPYSGTALGAEQVFRDGTVEATPQRRHEHALGVRPPSAGALRGRYDTAGHPVAKRDIFSLTRRRKIFP